jgi:hypothetical protein
MKPSNDPSRVLTSDNDDTVQQELKGKPLTAEDLAKIAGGDDWDSLFGGDWGNLDSYLPMGDGLGGFTVFRE